MTKLSILVCTIPQRWQFYENLRDVLFEQMRDYETQVELLTDDHPTDNIGKKRNRLLAEAKGEYVASIDDDDTVSASYVRSIMEALHKNPNVDCCSLRGVITWDGKNPELFEHSTRYFSYSTTTNPIKYERYPNHLNTIKRSIAIQCKFPEINHGEDTDWATQLFTKGLIKSEVYIDKVLYHYLYRTRKTELL